MDTALWPQEIVVKPIEEIVTNTCPKPANLERKTSSTNNNSTTAAAATTRPQKEQALNCPRCNSTNTKFCYYNNYSLTQPRYFCKTCRRYWTEGGSLRNIPVGGGSRKNKRSSSSSNSTITTSTITTSNNNSSSPSSSSKKLPDLVTPPILSASLSHQNPNKIHDGQDLNLAFPSSSTPPPHGIRTFSDLISLPLETKHTNSSACSTSAAASCAQISALELLTGISTRGLNSFLPNMQVQDPNSVYSTSGGFNPLQVDFKPSLNFSLDGIGATTGGGVGGGGYGGLPQERQLLFPFEDLKQVTSTRTSEIEQNREHGDSTGYWTGMLGGGSW